MAKQIDYICVLDFEANCMKKGTPDPQEIIEFPVLLVDACAGDVRDIFHTYVKPDVHPNISQFCTDLTGITREIVNNGVSLEQTLVAHQAWLDRHKLVPAWLPKTSADQSTFLYLTCGDWDLKTCLPRQLAYHGQDVPTFAERWINIKPVFMQVYKIHTKRGLGMVTMLEILNLDQLGRHHSGIDDCRNIALIVKTMIQAGWRPNSESWTSTTSTAAV